MGSESKEGGGKLRGRMDGRETGMRLGRGSKEIMDETGSSPMNKARIGFRFEVEQYICFVPRPFGAVRESVYF